MGDLQGHDFHGNQWTQGSEGGNRDAQVSRGDYAAIRSNTPQIAVFSENRNVQERALLAKGSAEKAMARLDKLGINTSKVRITAVDVFPGSGRANGTLGVTLREPGISGKTREIMLNVMDRYWGRREVEQAQLFKSGTHSSADRDHVALHEIGHALHADFMKDLKWSINDSETARGVSRYAGTHPHEFVAEVFAAGIAGRAFDYATRELYTRFNGPHQDVVFRNTVKRSGPV